MFFRRTRPKVPTFQERVSSLANAGFNTQSTPDGRVRILKNGVAAVIGDEGEGQSEIEKAGILYGNEIATLVSAGYQMFFETPSGKRFPAHAEQLKAIHEFEDDLKEALDLTNLYNTSLGTTTPKHMYDRVNKRDSGQQPKPWKHDDHTAKEPETKGSLHL
jgi:hypothetical protein